MKIMQILTNLAVVFWVLSLRFLVTIKFGFTCHKATFQCSLEYIHIYIYRALYIRISIRAKEEGVFRCNVLNTKANACKVLRYTYVCSNAFHCIFLFLECHMCT